MNKNRYMLYNMIHHLRRQKRKKNNLYSKEVKVNKV